MKSIAVLVLAATCAGCASSHMATVAQPAALADPDPQAATMIFYRTSMFGGAIQSSVFDVTSGDAELVGIVSQGTRVAYRAPPGLRRYMVIGESADFMDADAAPGRTYHARVRPRIGWWKARFSLVPVPASDPDLAEDLADCEWVENTPSSREWARDNMASIRSKMEEDLVEWEGKAERPRLGPEDGAR